MQGNYVEVSILLYTESSTRYKLQLIMLDPTHGGTDFK